MWFNVSTVGIVDLLLSLQELLFSVQTLNQSINSSSTYQLKFNVLKVVAAAVDLILDTLDHIILPIKYKHRIMHVNIAQNPENMITGRNI